MLDITQQKQLTHYISHNHLLTVEIVFCGKIVI